MPMGSYVRIRREPSPSESFRTHLPHSNVCVLRNALTGPVSQQRNLLPNCNVHIKASCQHFQSWITADIIMEAGCRWMCLKASQELIDEFFYFWTWLVICHYQSHVCCTPPPLPRVWQFVWERDSSELLDRYKDLGERSHVHVSSYVCLCRELGAQIYTLCIPKSTVCVKPVPSRRHCRHRHTLHRGTEVWCYDTKLIDTTWHNICSHEPRKKSSKTRDALWQWRFRVFGHQKARATKCIIWSMLGDIEDY